MIYFINEENQLITLVFYYTSCNPKRLNKRLKKRSD